MEIEDGVATFPNGLRLKLTPRQIAPQAIYDTAARHMDPPVPIITVTRNGQQEKEENPDDPAYLAAVEAVKERRAWAVVKALGVLGTELDAPPPGTPGPGDVDWERVALVRDIPTPTNKLEQYELWLRYYGFAHGYPSLGAGLADYVDLMRYLAVEAGMSMEAPSALAATFRAAEAGAANTRGDILAAPLNGDVGGRPTAGDVV